MMSSESMAAFAAAAEQPDYEEPAGPRERPILFSGEMVRAILDERKTQTRRVITPQPNNPQTFGVSPIWGHGTADGWSSRRVNGLTPGAFYIHAAFNEGGTRKDRFLCCPYGNVGDRLWVRETWAKPGEVGDHTEYRADNPDPLGAKWRPSIHMPRWASRLTLEITQVRVERIRDCVEGDARAEGAPCIEVTADAPGISGMSAGPSYREGFAQRWNALNGKRGYGWESNCWVWVIGFRPLSTGQGAKE